MVACFRAGADHRKVLVARHNSTHGRTEPDIARARNLFFSPFKEEEGERARRGVGEGYDRGVL